MFDTITDVRFEKSELRSGDVAIKLIAFELDEDTGAKSVADILEFDSTERAIKQIAKIAQDYENAKFGFYSDTGTKTLNDFETSRARNLKTKLERAIAAMEVRAYD